MYGLPVPSGHDLLKPLDDGCTPASKPRQVGCVVHAAAVRKSIDEDCGGLIGREQSAVGLRGRLIDELSQPLRWHLLDWRHRSNVREW